MTIPAVQFTDGITRYSGASAFALEQMLRKKLGLEDLPVFDPNQSYSEEEIWPLYRVAYEAGLFSHMPEGLPLLSYPVTSDVDIERAPLGADLYFPNIVVENQPTDIAGFPVDFPLGGPASMVTSNAEYLKHYGSLGFDILTYKTVRSTAWPANRFPQWVFLPSADQRLTTEELDTAIKSFEAYRGRKTEKDPVKEPADFLRSFVGQSRYAPQKREEASTANSFGVPSLDPKWWMDDVASVRSFVESSYKARRSNKVLIVSVMATVPPAEDISRDFIRTAKMAEEAGAQIIELNLSCPNTSEKVGEIYNYASDAARIAQAVKKAVNAPIFVKIGYMRSEKLRALVKKISPFVDGIVAINTVSARIKDEAGGQIFQRKTAGLSGWVIKDVAQKTALDLVKIRDSLGRADTLAILGTGGVMNESNFRERLSAGVNAVEACTGAFFDPLLALKIRKANSSLSEVALASTDGRMESEAAKQPMDAQVSAHRLGAHSASEREGSATMNAHAKSSAATIDFQGTIIQRDPDGFYGEVELENDRHTGGTAFFRSDVLSTPSLRRYCQVGSRVKGRAEQFGSTFRIVHLEQLAK